MHGVGEERVVAHVVGAVHVERVVVLARVGLGAVLVVAGADDDRIRENPELLLKMKDEPNQRYVYDK